MVKTLSHIEVEELQEMRSGAFAVTTSRMRIETEEVSAAVVWLAD